ncbi:unnamed protein product [Calicophoron daubneyi]|uniref:Lysosomal Pro-X carboxypeptidase n=1 Tax=Calicophoron daubneyi TaxID=300641 RepID=A0AAV2TH56_CALDB
MNELHSLLVFLCFVFQSCLGDNSSSIPWPPKVKYFTQPTDHFSFHAGILTFAQRYLYEDKWYKSDGPILFYCGNEGEIEGFWNNSGYIFELAVSTQALVVFAEHRYYGESLPFPNCFTQPYIQYLSVEQALADFAYLIEYLKHERGFERSPVIAFGGSYGGMLAAYMRAKYPHLVAGAIASSAPVYWIAGMGRFHEFFERVTKDYTSVAETCSSRIKDAYLMAEKLASTGEL